jgi:hypothetical protein
MGMAVLGSVSVLWAHANWLLSTQTRTRGDSATTFITATRPRSMSEEAAAPHVEAPEQEAEAMEDQQHEAAAGHTGEQTPNDSKPADDLCRGWGPLAR